MISEVSISDVQYVAAAKASLVVRQISVDSDVSSVNLTRLVGGARSDNY